MGLRMVTLTLCLVGFLTSSLVLCREIRNRRELPNEQTNFQYIPPHPVNRASPGPAKLQNSNYEPPLALSPAIQASQGSYQPPLPQFSSVQQPTLLTAQPKKHSSEVPRVVGNIELSQSPPVGTIDATDNRSKAVGSSYRQSQAIHKAPASEIHSVKVGTAKDRDGKNDEYVVYYYYYYDNDTSANNLTLNFDDIPTLESYDNSKEPQKSASARSIAANVNSLSPSVSDIDKKDVTKLDSSVNNSESGSLQPRSASSGNEDIEPEIQADKPASVQPEAVVQPLKPVSNVFRYGSNEVPRFPILPNFIVSNEPTEITQLDTSASPTTSSPLPTTSSTPLVSVVPSDERFHVDTDNDEANNVLESESKSAAEDPEKISAAVTTTTKVTTPEPPTTTEVVTTTEKNRRRPGAVIAGRRRFNPSSVAPTRSRSTPAKDTTSATKTTSAPEISSTKSSFRSPSGSNRLRPRQPLGSNRPRSPLSGRTSAKDEDSKPANTTSTTITRSRQSTTAAPRRFAGSRSSTSRAPALSSTISTTPRSRTTSRPRSNLVTRNRPRPGLLRPRPSKEEAVETTTVVVETESPKDDVPVPSPESVGNEHEEENENESEDGDETTTAAEETEEPTTTEKNRFSALFRPRNRNTPGNRPRPVIANRPPRSR